MHRVSLSLPLLRRCQHLLLVLVEDLLEQVPDRLEDLFAGHVGEVEVVVQIVVRDGAVELHESLGDVNNLYFGDRQELLLDDLVDFVVFLAQRVRLVTTRQQRRNHHEAVGMFFPNLVNALGDALRDLLGRAACGAVVGAAVQDDDLQRTIEGFHPS